LNKEQKQKYIDAIFELPNRIIFGLFHPLDEEFETMVDENIAYLDMKGTSVKREEFIKLIQGITVAVILSLYDQIAFSAISIKTKRKLLDSVQEKTLNQKIQQLLFVENSGDTKRLAEMAIDICDNNKKPIINNMVAQVVRKHLLTRSNIDRKIEQKLVDKFFNSHKKALLLEQAKKKRT
jgi:hypothetical protein